MNSRLFLWSLVSALAGFLFGFDTVVISGAEKTIQALWGLSPAMHGLAMGAALWGTVLGSAQGIHLWQRVFSACCAGRSLRTSFAMLAGQLR